MKFLAIAALAAGLTVTGAASAATNLITNGSFESGTFDWIRTGSDGSNPSTPATIITYNNNLGYPLGAFGESIPTDTIVGGSPEAAGTHAAYFVGDHSNESLSQVVTGLAVGVYSIGFDVYIPFNGQANVNDAAFTGSIALTNPTTPAFSMSVANFNVGDKAAGGWTSYYGTFNVETAGDYTVAFTFNTNGFPAKDIVVDRAFLVAGAVPEASTWALMMVGFGGLGAVLRTQRRRSFAAA